VWSQPPGKITKPKTRFGESSRLERRKETPCRDIGGSGSYSSQEYTPSRDFVRRGRDRSDIKWASKTVFGGESITQNGASGAMQIVDSGCFSYN